MSRDARRAARAYLAEQASGEPMAWLRGRHPAAASSPEYVSAFCGEIERLRTGPQTQTPASDPGPRLSATGAVYVTYSAAKRYAEQAAEVYEGGQPIREVEEARRELTEILLDATRRVGAEGPEEWRYRNRTRGVDVTARVTREGRLAIVVSVNARAYR